MTLVAISVSSLAVQQLMQMLSPVLVRLAGDGGEKTAFGLASAAAGILLAWACEIGILDAVGISDDVFLNSLVTGLMIGTGTGGFNSMLKALGYAKESKKGSAAGQISKASKRSARRARLDR
jgi:hypothetical protein